MLFRSDRDKDWIAARYFSGSAQRLLGVGGGLALGCLAGFLIGYLFNF
ncbi:MAG: hypothetical protein R3C60_10585 [Parvularculaceae bacterium]